MKTMNIPEVVTVEQDRWCPWCYKQVIGAAVLSPQQGMWFTYHPECAPLPTPDAQEVRAQLAACTRRAEAAEQEVARLRAALDAAKSVHERLLNWLDANEERAVARGDVETYHILEQVVGWVLARWQDDVGPKLAALSAALAAGGEGAGDANG